MTMPMLIPSTPHGASNGANPDAVLELRSHLDKLYRWAECGALAEGNPQAQKIWRELQEQEEAEIKQLKETIHYSIENGIFLQGL